MMPSLQKRLGGEGIGRKMTDIVMDVGVKWEKGS